MNYMESTVCKMAILIACLCALVVGCAPVSGGNSSEIKICRQIYKFDGSRACAAKANEAICRDFLSHLLEFERQANAYKADAALPARELVFCARSRIFFDGQKFFSCRNIYDTYLGGAHGHEESTCFNFVFGEGGAVKNLGLFDVFDFSKREGLSALIAGELVGRYKGGLLVDLGAPGASDYILNSIAGFAISRDKVWIFFRKYSVACGACAQAPISLDMQSARKFFIDSAYIEALLR